MRALILFIVTALIAGCAAGPSIDISKDLKACASLRSSMKVRVECELRAKRAMVQQTEPHNLDLFDVMATQVIVAAERVDRKKITLAEYNAQRAILSQQAMSAARSRNIAGQNHRNKLFMQGMATMAQSANPPPMSRPSMPRQTTTDCTRYGNRVQCNSY